MLGNIGIRQGLILEYTTLAWNVVGVVVVFYAAFMAHSIALAGFGLDSLIEILASAVVVWQLTDKGKSRMVPALKTISVAFAALAIYILAQAIKTLLSNAHPLPSGIGMAWLFVTLIAMLMLAHGKALVGKKINSALLTTEGKVTLIDAYLAAAVLLGIVLNATLGWWWADPLAGLVIIFYGTKESIHAWQEAAELARQYP